MSESGSIFAKVAAVMGEMHRVPKSGKNTFHNYTYSTEADLLDEVRPIMAKHRLAVLPSIEEVTTDAEMMRVKVTFLLGDADGNTLERSFYGESKLVLKNSRDDKALYKAYTGAVKYFIFKTFLVSSGDDPEMSEEAAVQAPQQTQKPPEATGQAAMQEAVNKGLQRGVGLSKEKAQGLHIQLTRAGFAKQEEHYWLAAEVTGRHINSLTELNTKEAIAVFDAAKKQQAEKEAINKPIDEDDGLSREELEAAAGA